MSNHIVNVSTSTHSMVSGSTISVQVEYESDDGGPVQVLTGGGFAVNPTAHTVSPAPFATVTVPLTVTRGSATTRSCRLVFQFFSSSRELLMEVT